MKRKKLCHKGKPVDNTTVGKKVKIIESFRHENDTLTKILSRTLEGNDRLDQLLRESRHHPTNKV